MPIYTFNGESGLLRASPLVLVFISVKKFRLMRITKHNTLTVSTNHVGREREKKSFQNVKKYANYVNLLTCY